MDLRAAGARLGAVSCTAVRAGRPGAEAGVPANAVRLLGTAARVVWVPVALMCATIVAVDAVRRYSAVSELSVTVGPGWTPAGEAAALRRLGLSPADYAVIGFVLAVVGGLVWFGAAALVTWRGWTSRFGWLTAYFLVLFGTSWLIEPSRLPVGIRPVARWMDAVSWACFLLFFFLFPSGRFAPRWLRWPVPLLLLAGLVVQLVAPDGQPGSQLVLWLFPLAVAAAAQIWRYRAISGPMERRQSRWLVFGFAGTLCGVLTLLGVGALFRVRPPTAGALVYELVGQSLGALLFLPIPLAVMIGMTRHGLWDVDVLVNRVLVYGSLSALITAVYGLAVGTGLVVARGRGLAISVLVGALVAVLFNPARSALQSRTDSSRG